MNRYLRLFLSVWAVLAGGLISSAQPVQLNILGLEKSRIKVPSGKYNDWGEAQQEVIRFKENLILAGYLANGPDSQYTDASSWTIWWNLGEAYQWALLKPGNVDEEILRKAGYNPSGWTNKRFEPSELNKLTRRIVEAYSMKGYPFATVRVKINGGTAQHIQGELWVDPYLLFTIDTVLWGADLNLNPKYLQHYTGLVPGNIYQDELAKKSDALLKQLSFVVWNAPSQVSFQGNKATITHYISGRKVSYFDGIVGMAPNSANNADRFLLTGEANLQLQNIKGTGAMLQAQWKSFLRTSQDLKASGQYPYLFGTRLGIAPSINFLKLDTIYSTFQWEIGLPYILTGNNQFRIFYQQGNTRLITADTAQVRRTRKVPGFNDMVQRSYGIGWQMQRLDELLIPKKGFRFSIDGSVGSRRILRNSEVEQVRFSDGPTTVSVYDGADSLFLQWRGTWKGEYYWNPFRKQVIQFYTQGSFLFSDGILENELFRIGGIKDLRGFDEQSIWCSQYYLGRIEYRYLLDRSTFVQLFANAAWIERKTVSNYATDLPYGFGAGVSFLTGPGLFSFNYALGSQQGNPLQFRSAKIHFGFVSYF